MPEDPTGAARPAEQAGVADATPADAAPVETRRPALAHLETQDDEARLQTLTATLEAMRRELDDAS